LLVSDQAKIRSPEDVAGKTIAVVPNTVAEDTLLLIQPEVKVLPVKNLQAGLEALRDGKVFGVAGDGLQIAGLRQVLGMTNTQLVPDSPQINYGVGCMVRQYNPGFLRLANYALVKLAEGYYYGDPEDVALVNQWMGQEGVVTVDPEMIKRFFNYLSVTHEQIPEGLGNGTNP
jgi:polar amino acid transport system substrate-binding protein